MVDGKREGRFLDRWSQRKLRQHEPDGNPEPETSGERQEPGEQADARRRQLEKNREEAEAIDLASLTADSDFSPFFRDGVPKALKSAAMRVLWRSNPVFANLDGLNDYDENFADPELIKKFAGSAWQIGKGYLTEDTDAGEDAERPPPADGTQPDEDERLVASGDETGDTDEQPADGQSGTESAGGAAGAQDDGDRLGGPDDEVAAPERVPLRHRLALDEWEKG